MSVSRPEEGGSFSVGRGESPSKSESPADVEASVELVRASTLGGRAERGREVMPSIAGGEAISEDEEGRGVEGEMARRVIQRFEGGGIGGRAELVGWLISEGGKIQDRCRRGKRRERGM